MCHLSSIFIKERGKKTGHSEPYQDNLHSNEITLCSSSLQNYISIRCSFPMYPQSNSTIQAAVFVLQLRRINLSQFLFNFIRIFISFYRNPDHPYIENDWIFVSIFHLKFCALDRKFYPLNFRQQQIFHFFFWYYFISLLGLILVQFRQLSHFL